MQEGTSGNNLIQPSWSEQAMSSQALKISSNRDAITSLDSLFHDLPILTVFFFSLFH